MQLKYTDLSAFTKGYVDAMFFTEQEQLDEDAALNHHDDMGVSFLDFAPETISKIVTDCAGFEMGNAAALAAAYASEIPFSVSTNSNRGVSVEPYTPECAGHDFWLTRNGHGAGFWDRNLGESGALLTNACGHGTRYPAQDLYLGDDGRLYLS